MQPTRTQEIIEEAETIEIEPQNIVQTATRIFLNNAIIAFVTLLGSIIIIYGVNLAINNIGAVFGAVTITLTPINALLVLGTFGILEFLGFLFALMAGLLFPKYLIVKLLYHNSFRDFFTDSSLSFFYSIVFLGIAAVVEALLLNVETALLAFLIGAPLTVILLRLLFERG
jgi:uncharacterized membrane protein SpoIIM required for sporulation